MMYPDPMETSTQCIPNIGIFSIICSHRVPFYARRVVCVTVEQFVTPKQSPIKREVLLK